MTAPPAARRSLRSRLSVWIWAVLHIRAVLRHAIGGVYAAKDAQKRVGWVEDRVLALTDYDEHLQAAVEALRARTDTLTSTMATMTGRTDTLMATIRGQADTSNTAMMTIRDGVNTLRAVASDLETQTQALNEQTQALNEQTQALNEQTQALDERLLALRAEIMFQQRRLTRLSIPAAAASVKESATGVVDQRLDSLYVAFEDLFRGSREDIKGRLLPYVDRLTLAGAGQQDKPIVDIGCGRGEWLELLKESGLNAYGIDINTIMIERSAALGLDARHSDLIAHLNGINDAERSALTAFHVVEHLPFTTLVDFLDEALRVLIPGGLLILETPNPETVRVGASTFYNDPTHRNPLMPDPLRFIVKHRGFTEVEILKLHPFTQGLLQEKTADAAMLNSVLFGPQDYALIARRP